MNNGQHRSSSSTGREQPDEGFDRLLRSALSSEEVAAGSACLDAETLATWCEGALSPSERSFADAHVARCARCQSLLAVMARTAPVDQESKPWSVRQWFMMLAPAATATAAIALWFIVGDAPRRSPQSVVEVARSEADAASQALASRPPAAVAPPQAASSASSASGDRRDELAAGRSPAEQPAISEENRRLADAKDALQKRAEAVVVDGVAKKELARRSNEAGVAAGEDKAAAPAKPVAESVVAVTSSPALDANAANNRMRGYTANANAANTANAPGASNTATDPAPAAKPSPPPPPAAPVPFGGLAQGAPSSPQSPTQAQGRTDQQQAQSDQVLRAPSQSAGAGAGRGGGGARAAQTEAPADRAPSIAFASPDASVQWRVVSQRVIQQSIDKGVTWATQYSVDEKSALVAGSAPAQSVAWVVGRAGLVLVTADGRTWRRVPLPENIDLIAVAAIDGDNAIVTASDRRVFSTSNGGRSWAVKK